MTVSDTFDWLQEVTEEVKSKWVELREMARRCGDMQSHRGPPDKVSVDATLSPLLRQVINATLQEVYAHYVVQPDGLPWLWNEHLFQAFVQQVMVPRAVAKYDTAELPPAIQPNANDAAAINAPQAEQGEQQVPQPEHGLAAAVQPA